MPIRLPRKTSRSWYPWGCFLLFLVSNSLLSYFSLPTGLWVGLFLLGILAPLAITAFTRTPMGKREGEIGSTEFFPFPGWGALGLVLLAALFIRFYKLSSLSAWPLMDEGLTGYFAMEGSAPGAHPFFYSAAQIPPLYFWLESLCFRWLGPSLTALWFLPALLSLLLVPLSYLAARAYFSRSFALLAGALFAVSFWPFYLGRYSMPHGLLVVWELGALGILGLFLKEKKDTGLHWKALALGAWVGGGFYIEFHWPLAALLVTLAVVGKLWPSRRWSAVGVYGLALAAVSLPFWEAVVREKAGAYLSMLWAFHSGSTLAAQWNIGWDYLSGLFWGVDTTRHAYKPFWGGFLNPLWGAFFGLGLVELIRGRRGKTAWALGLGLILFLLPGWLTRELELFRIVLILPFLLAVVVLGLESASRRLPLARRGAWVLAFLAAGAGLDFYHLLGPYQWACHTDVKSFSNYSKSYERWVSWQKLEQKSREEGPGLILTELESSPFDQSLAVASYPFNAALNPRFSPGEARWGAFLVNINEAPFLSKRFPQIQWLEPCLKEMEPQESLVLAIVDLGDPKMKAAFQSWLDFDRALHPATSQALHLRFGGDHGEILRELQNLEPRALSDPLLLDCLAERIFFTAMSDNNYGAALAGLRLGLQEGDASANLYNDLGVLWFAQGDYPKAREAFQAALRSPLNHTTAAWNLQRTPGS